MVSHQDLVIRHQNLIVSRMKVREQIGQLEQMLTNARITAQHIDANIAMAEDLMKASAKSEKAVEEAEPVEEELVEAGSVKEE